MNTISLNNVPSSHKKKLFDSLRSIQLRVLCRTSETFFMIQRNVFFFWKPNNIYRQYAASLMAINDELGGRIENVAKDVSGLDAALTEKINTLNATGLSGSLTVVGSYLSVFDVRKKHIKS